MRGDAIRCYFRFRHPHTLRYAAPEVLDGEPVNDRSDVYAYGMLLYEIFSGNVRSSLHSGRLSCASVSIISMCDLYLEEGVPSEKALCCICSCLNRCT